VENSAGDPAVDLPAAGCIYTEPPYPSPSLLTTMILALIKYHKLHPVRCAHGRKSLNPLQVVLCPRTVLQGKLLHAAPLSCHNSRRLLVFHSLHLVLFLDSRIDEAKALVSGLRTAL
jgi:hypothetical protein